MTQPTTRNDSPFIFSPEGSRVDTTQTAPDYYSPRSRKHSTKLACKFCRKKRVKCDGHLPCGHCKTHQKDCVYEKSDQRTKSSLRNEIDSLRKSLHVSEAIFNALRQPQYRDFIVEQLQKGASKQQIAEILQALATEDAARTPQQGQDVTCQHPGPMGGMPATTGTGATNMPNGPWRNTGEGELAPVYANNATPPEVFWNPLFLWPSDNGALLPFGLDTVIFPSHDTGPAGGPSQSVRGN